MHGRAYEQQVQKTLHITINLDAAWPGLEAFGWAAVAIPCTAFSGAEWTEIDISGQRRGSLGRRANSLSLSCKELQPHQGGPSGLVSVGP